MSVPSRGLRDIRTLSGNVGQITLPHRAYMRLSCLEMERFRRNQEKTSAVRRINNIDGRIQEIEVEKAALLRSLDDRVASHLAGRPVGGLTAPRQRLGGFKLKY